MKPPDHLSVIRTVSSEKGTVTQASAVPESGNPAGPTSIPALPDLRFAQLLSQARTFHSPVVALRRKLHQNPEAGLDLPETQAAVLDALEGLPLEIHLGKSLSSITAVLRGKHPGPAVLLRADMDALPITEETGLDFASRNAGVMHACGHDGHTAMLAYAAHLLANHVSELAGSVVFMFQPGEEGQHGARHMIHEGVLDVAGSRVESAFALHLSPNLPQGQLATKPGPMMASDDSFFITVTGKGGHGSAPHTTIDPIPAIAAMVGAFQNMITRRTSAFEPAVLSVTRLLAGENETALPETASMEGTMRTFSGRTKSLLREEVHKICEGIAAAHGCRVAVDIVPGYSAMINDSEQAQRVLWLAGQVLGKGRAVELTEPLMAAEDFSYVAQRVPAVIALLGACPANQDPVDAEGLHSTKAIFDENALLYGIAMHAAFALDALRRSFDQKSDK